MQRAKESIRPESAKIVTMNRGRYFVERLDETNMIARIYVTACIDQCTGDW
jgi:hypothetical protein